MALSSGKDLSHHLADSGSRLLPVVLVWSAGAAALVVHDTGLGTVLSYSLFLALGIMLPGTLLWRALRGNVDGFAADVAFGTALGFGLTVLVYLPARAAGRPLLALALPLGIAAVFCAPRLRGHWRSNGPVMPRWWTWTVAAACTLGVAVQTRWGLMVEPIRYPDAAVQYIDMPYHLALAAELKHHLPAQIPYVIGEPLHYHWFVHAHLATSSWQSGVELDVLLRRLFPMAATVLIVFGIAVLTAKLARRAWVGALAAWLLLLVSDLDVYGWNGINALTQNSFSTGVLMYSPTHTLAVLLSVPAILLVTSLVRGSAATAVAGVGAGVDPARRWGTWVLLAILAAALSGTKPTPLPMIAASCGLVFVVHLVAQGRARGPGRFNLTALGITAGSAAATVASQLVLYGGDTVGTKLALVDTFRSFAPKLGFPSGRSGELAVLSTAATLLVAWGLAGIGMIGFARARAWRDPAAVFLAGYLLAGLGPVVVLSQTGTGQQYFTRAAFPIVAAGSAWGLALLLSGKDRPARPRTLAAICVGGYGAGMALGWGISRLNLDHPVSGSGPRAIAWQTSWPWLAVLGAGLVAGALALAALRATAAPWHTRGVAAGVAVLVLFGAASVRVPGKLAEAVLDRPCVGVVSRPGCAHPPRVVPDSGDAAARYIRAHSRPTDVLATNSHCIPEYRKPDCDPRNFWLSGLAERRVLVEGWSYTPTLYKIAKTPGQAFFGPFWDRGLLAANDAVFGAPTRENIALLRDRYGVRWLVVDRNLTGVSAELGRLLPQRFAAGAVAVFEIT